MKIRSEFYDFGKQFSMACHDQLPSTEETIKSALNCMNVKDQEGIKIFLSTLLSGEHSTADMKGIWKKVRGQHRMNARQTADFFQMVHDLI
jgi:hypothetical protein